MKRAPRRLQRKRTKGWRAPEGAVCVTRPGRFGNPYRIEKRRSDCWIVFYGLGQILSYHGNRESAASTAVHWFERDLLAGKLRVSVEDVRRELRGCDLLCYCPLPKAGEPDVCHAASLLRIANEEP